MTIAFSVFFKVKEKVGNTVIIPVLRQWIPTVINTLRLRSLERFR